MEASWAWLKITRRLEVEVYRSIGLSWFQRSNVQESRQQEYIILRGFQNFFFLVWGGNIELSVMQHIVSAPSLLCDFLTITHSYNDTVTRSGSILFNQHILLFPDSLRRTFMRALRWMHIWIVHLNAAWRMRWGTILMRMHRGGLVNACQRLTFQRRICLLMWLFWFLLCTLRFHKKWI